MCGLSLRDSGQNRAVARRQAQSRVIGGNRDLAREYFLDEGATYCDAANQVETLYISDSGFLRADLGLDGVQDKVTLPKPKP